MRLPRMTTRRWMIAMAIIGLLLGGGVHLKRRRDRFLARAGSHAWKEDLLRVMERAGNPFTQDVDLNRARVARLRPEIARQAALRQKWEHAACYPWLPVESDPPSPK